MTYAEEVGQRLRAIRKAQGLSLGAVEKKSGGKIGAIVLGTYERGARNVSVTRLRDLAAFYGLPLAALLPGAETGLRTVDVLELVQAMGAARDALDRVIAIAEGEPERNDAT